jgi:hypothetical protein
VLQIKGETVEQDHSQNTIGCRGVFYAGLGILKIIGLVKQNLVEIRILEKIRFEFIN